jgi:hypothetical protein
MLVLNDMADAGTAEIPERHTPSLTVLARETGLNESTVKRHLAELERLGWVVRSRPTEEGARLRSERTQYRLSAPGPGAESPQGGAEEAQTRAHTEPSPGRTVRPLKEDSRSLPDPPSGDAKTKRGGRIPSDFTVTARMRTWAMANVPQLAGSRETEKFKNYWAAAAGRTAIKVDWEAAWRNWMLKAAEMTAERNGGARASPSSAPVVIPIEDRCPYHRDQRAGKCRHCKARALTKPKGGTGAAGSAV